MSPGVPLGSHRQERIDISDMHKGKEAMEMHIVASISVLRVSIISRPQVMPGSRKAKTQAINGCGQPQTLAQNPRGTRPLSTVRELELPPIVSELLFRGQLLRIYRLSQLVVS